MTSTNELKNRVDAKKHELLARLAQLEADSRAEARKQRERIQKELDEVEQQIKDGWEKLGAPAVAKLKDWLKRV